MKLSESITNQLRINSSSKMPGSTLSAWREEAVQLEEALSDKIIKIKGALLLMGKAENKYVQLNDESKYDGDLIAELSDEINVLQSQIDAMRDFMALLYLGIREGREEAFEALDEKTKHLINEVWFERLEEDSEDETE